VRVVIPGGSGQIGQILAREFARRGAEVVVLTRGSRVSAGRAVDWDGRSLGDWAEQIDGAEVVINLAGRSVNCRYSDPNLKQMMDSRVDSTRVVGEAIEQAAKPPRVWLQMSTATIYAHRYDSGNDEATGILGGDEEGVPAYWGYSVQIAKNWEQALDDANTPETRRVALRAAMVMTPDRGGIFDLMLGMVRRGLGGTAGDGRQFVSWIHGDDFVAAIHHLIDSDLSGPVNLASPGPLPYGEFMAALRRAWGTRIGLPATKWMLEVGAFFMRTDTELVLKSRRVVPGRLLDAGFTFGFEDWPESAQDLVARWRADA
jgi:uncharacterized protein (TIGR01777 family)